MSNNIIIIDYGVGNLLSISQAVEKCGFKFSITSDEKTISQASHIILPGVGAFSAGMNALTKNKFDLAINNEIQKGIPILGICLGFQMFFSESNEHGFHKGLGLIDGKVKILRECEGYNNQIIPNTGWRKLKASSLDGIFKGYNNDNFFYFIHSYYIEPNDTKIITSQCLYEGIKINASIQKDNIFGLQFHPEKSGDIGLNILKNFIDY